jgi:hypothetical protein
MTIFTVLEVLIFPRWKKHTSIHSSDFKQQGQNLPLSVLMGCMSIRTINFDLI